MAWEEKMSAQSYFANQAEGYDQRLKTGPLGKIREAEKNAILKALDPKKEEIILDIPCGSGYYAECIEKAGARVYGVDISSEMINVFLNKGYEGRVGNLENFSIGKKFDKVLSAGGFEFCKNHEKIIQNLVVHTKESGSIVLLLPRKSFFGYLYKLYHKLCNKTDIIIFSNRQIKEMCKGGRIKNIDLSPCSLFSIVVKVRL